jgi:hypothetical protein
MFFTGNKKMWIPSKLIKVRIEQEGSPENLYHLSKKCLVYLKCFCLYFLTKHSTMNRFKNKLGGAGKCSVNFGFFKTPVMLWEDIFALIQGVVYRAASDCPEQLTLQSCALVGE